MTQPIDLTSLLNSAYYFLKFRPRSKKEITDYLIKKVKKRRGSDDLIWQAIGQLEKERLINDTEFVRWLVESRIAGKPKGERAIRYELRRLGISDDLVSSYLTDHPIIEENAARRFLQGRFARIKKLPVAIGRRKAIQWLLSRGFDYDIAKKICNDLVGVAKNNKEE